MNKDMVEHVAKKLCDSARIYDPKVNPDLIVCPICRGDSELCVWKSFLPEAEAAISAVKDFAILSLRRKPRI